MGNSLGARLCRLEQRAGGSQHLVVVFRVVGGGASDDEGEPSTSLIHPYFLGNWFPAERATEIDRLRAEYPGVPIDEAQA